MAAMPKPVTLAGVRASLARDRVAVISTIGPDGCPQAALVGFALGDRLDLIFDTATDSRKHANLVRDPRVAVVVGGWGDEHTIQLQGRAVPPTGQALERARAHYFAVYPSGRDRAADPSILIYVITPTWVHYSDYATTPATIAELDLSKR